MLENDGSNTLGGSFTANSLSGAAFVKGACFFFLESVLASDFEAGSSCSAPAFVEEVAKLRSTGADFVLSADGGR